MRRLHTAIVALLLTGCSSTAPIPPAPGDTSGYFTVGVRGNDRFGGSLAASSVWVDLEEEAYVAVFRVGQEEGAVLLWPYTEESPRTLPAGPTNLPPQTSNERRIAERRARALFPEPPMEPRGAQPQNLVLVVASLQPLNLDRYLMDFEALRRDLAGDFIDVTGATSGILDLLIDNPQGHNWAWACSGTPIWCRGR